ncbi:MAG: ABC transporter substrate-binding protein [Bradymonadia bacterium]
MMRRLLHSLMITLLGVAMAAPAGAQSQTFRYPEDNRPSSLMPFFAEDMSSVRMVELIFDSLIYVDKRGDFAPGLATSWEVDPDRGGIRFVLREGINWHDGKPFTADDVKFTIDAAQDPGTVFNAKGKYRFINTVTVEGKFAVHFTFTRPVAEPERRFLFKIIPKHKFKKTAISRKDKFARQPVGTGPFMVKKGGFSVRSVNLEANPGYFNPVQVASVEMQHTPDKAGQVSVLKYSGGSAGVQAVIFLPPKEIPVFENSDSVVLEPYHTVSWWYMAYNHKNKALNDNKVRQAIALALNRQELVEAHLGRGDILSGPFTESSPFYNFEVELREQDVARANQILDEAGYAKKGRYRKKGKAKLEFKFVLDKELASNQELFLGIQAQLRKIGIKVTPQYLDHARYRELVFVKKNFDMTLNVWSFEEVEDVYPLFHSDGVMNFIGFNSEKVDGLLDQAKATRDYKKYKELMKEIHQVVNAELPYFFLWSLDIYSGISKRVKNVFIQPYYYFTSFEDWGLSP